MIKKEHQHSCQDPNCHQQHNETVEPQKEAPKDDEKLSKGWIKNCKTAEECDVVLREKLGIGFSECSQALCNSLQERAEELLTDLPNLTPYGDYSKTTEDHTIMLQFLLDEATKVENWKISYLEAREDRQLMELVFTNKAVDDGDNLKGFVFLGVSGKIRHAFCQMHV